MELILTFLSRTKESFYHTKTKTVNQGSNSSWYACDENHWPQGAYSQIFPRGSYFITKKITTSEFAYPKKSLLFLAYPKKSLSPFFTTQKNPCYFFSLPKKILVSFIDPKKSLLAKISDPKKSLGPPPPIIKN